MFKDLFKNQSEQEVIAEIHNEFDTAQDRLLNDAENLLKALDIETEETIKNKAGRLEKLGFTKSAPVQWLKNNSLIKTREEAELIKYYKQNYPFQKFLTEKELERICAKYKLVFAPVANYIKDVPEKNIQEIESAKKLNSLDNASDIVTTTRVPYRFIGGGTNFLAPTSKWQVLLPKVIEGSYSSVFDLDRYLNAKYNTGITYLSERITVNTIDRQGLFICAPQKHFDLKSLKKSGKYSFMNITITEVKDPIVFRYCRGGVQVLSKWGLEASDDLLVNEIYN